MSLDVDIFALAKTAAYMAVAARLNNAPEMVNSKAKNPAKENTPSMPGDHEITGGGQISNAIAGTSN